MALLRDSLQRVRADRVVQSVCRLAADAGAVLGAPGSALDTVRRVLTILRNGAMIDDADVDLAALPALPQLLFECIAAAARDALASRLALELLAAFAHRLSAADITEVRALTCAYMHAQVQVCVF